MSRTPAQRPWVATAILESRNPFTNDLRLEELTSIVDHTLGQCPGPGVLVFPGGHFSTGTRAPKTIYRWLEDEVAGAIVRFNRTIAICFGIDGGLTTITDDKTKDEVVVATDQIACAITARGFEARGRKFAPAPPYEKKIIQRAESPLSQEGGLSRVFSFLGNRYYLAVCYDSHGISHSSYDNPQCDAILNLVHGFYPRGQGPSGHTDFARKIFSGASKRWSVPVFASAVFFNRDILESWPSGVLWDRGSDLSVRDWLYEYNPLKPNKRLSLQIPEGSASIRVFSQPDGDGHFATHSGGRFLSLGNFLSRLRAIFPYCL